MELQDLLLNLNKNPKKIKDGLLQLGIDYNNFMLDYTGEAHKVGFIKFFIDELNKVSEDMTYSTRKNVIRKVYEVRNSRLLIYLSDYDLKDFFNQREVLYTNFKEKVTQRFMQYNDTSIQTMSIANDKRKRTISSIQNKVYDNLNLVLDTQRHVIVYLREKLIPLLNHNLMLVSKAPNKLVSELSIFERGQYQRNEQEINMILNQLKSYIDPAAVAKYSNILGVPFQVFGEEDASDLTPTVLMDTIYKVLAEKESTSDKYLDKVKEGLPNIVDSLEDTIKVPTMEELVQNDGDIEAIKEVTKDKPINVDSVTKLKGHRSLFDGSTYVDDDEVFTDYEVQEAEVIDEANNEKKLDLPEKDFLKETKKDEGHDDVLY